MNNTLSFYLTIHFYNWFTLFIKNYFKQKDSQFFYISTLSIQDDLCKILLRCRD